MYNKKEKSIKIICGIITLLIIGAFLIINNKMKDKVDKITTDDWEIYRNNELNIEVKHPANVEIEIDNVNN